MPPKVEYQKIEAGDDFDQANDSAGEPGPYGKLAISHHHSRLFLLWVAWLSCNLLLVTLPVGVICFYWGKLAQANSRTQLDWLSPPGHVKSVFRYQKPFTLAPDNNSSVLWSSLFPRGDGFVQHPEISPVPTCLAVYHQLHCLDAIRHGYWAAVDGVKPAHHGRPAHVRHCIDYLRQSLMCHADTNVEPIQADLGGVTGFGSEKTCRDYGRVTAWAETWRARGNMGPGH
ncbi:hypothetical protein F5X98DRAFT_337826 [Xylaria grammica]|nr:hypothetical protein F5X98DRAFT_337826 [Xylaria grammica]